MDSYTPIPEGIGVHALAVKIKLICILIIPVLLGMEPNEYQMPMNQISDHIDHDSGQMVFTALSNEEIINLRLCLLLPY